MIQKYLNAQLIQTTEDSNFEKLMKTCADVSKKISKDKLKILNYTLVAFDPDIPADNSEVKEIQNLIIEKWQTFLPNSKDTYLTIVRAVILEALETVSKENEINRMIIWLGSRNVVKHFKLSREKDILASFLLEIGNIIEGEVSERWNFPPDYEIEIPKVTAAT